MCPPSSVGCWSRLQAEGQPRERFTAFNQSIVIDVFGRLDVALHTPPQQADFNIVKVPMIQSDSDVIERASRLEAEREAVIVHDEVIDPEHCAESVAPSKLEQDCVAE